VDRQARKKWLGLQACDPYPARSGDDDCFYKQGPLIHFPSIFLVAFRYAQKQAEKQKELDKELAVIEVKRQHEYERKQRALEAAVADAQKRIETELVFDFTWG
jgi:hypothetical protein